MAKNAMFRQIVDADDPLNTLATPSVLMGVRWVPTRDTPIHWVYNGLHHRYRGNIYEPKE